MTAPFPCETDPLLEKDDGGNGNHEMFSRQPSLNPADEDEEVFATIRVLEPRPRTLHDGVSPLRNMENSFWDDVQNFTPGSMPHSTVVGITIGIMCGVLAYLYYTILEWLLEFCWEALPEILVVPFWPERLYFLWIPLLGYTMALGVGLSVRFLGEPGDLSYTVQCVHDKAYIEMSHVLPMLAASQFSILGGGSLGPEAPLVRFHFLLWLFFSQRECRTFRHTGLFGRIATILINSFFSLHVFCAGCHLCVLCRIRESQRVWHDANQFDSQTYPHGHVVGLGGLFRGSSRRIALCPGN